MARCDVKIGADRGEWNRSDLLNPFPAQTNDKRQKITLPFNKA
jgi:hypothetical protein